MKAALFIILVACLAVLLGGCATQPTQSNCPPPKVIDTACQWAQPIQVGASDTIETKKAALAAWKTYRKNCPAQ